MAKRSVPLKLSMTSSGLGTMLAQKGHRQTPQRILILAAMEQSERHIAAEEIFEQVRPVYPNLSITTVYRTLDLLVRLGLAVANDLGDGRTRYHLAQSARHHHLVCRICGKIDELDESLLASLGQALSANHGFTADLKHMVIFGTCADCTK